MVQYIVEVFKNCFLSVLRPAERGGEPNNIRNYRVFGDAPENDYLYNEVSE